MRLESTLVFGYLAASLGAGAALAADRIPTLAVEKTCRGASLDQAATGPGGKVSRDDQKSAYKSCLDSENAAKKAAAARWPRVKGESRRTCVSMASAIYPSYVELDACLQMYDPKDGTVNAPAVPASGAAPRQRQPRAGGGT